MAYFSNGTGGDRYVENYCSQCVNWRDKDDGRGPGCPVWDVHLDYAYDLANKKDDPGKQILDTLIPMKLDKVHAGECSMFQVAGEYKNPNQIDLFEAEK